jgi:hypothetical protein
MSLHREALLIKVMNEEQISSWVLLAHPTEYLMDQ